MVERALYDFADAAMGKNSDMRWSLSEAIMRRQVSPVFDRCASGDLTAEQALDVAVDFVSARVANTVEIFTDLFDSLEIKIDVQLHGVTFPTLLELQEFFMGLNEDVAWATDPKITRRELQPLFERVSSGQVSSRIAAQTFCDVISAKRDYYLSLLHAMVYRLTAEIVTAMHPVPQNNDVESDG